MEPHLSPIVPGAKITASLLQDVYRRAWYVNSISPGRAWGAVRFDRRASIRAEVEDESLAIRLGPFEGISRDGRPVVILGPDAAISARCDLRGRREVVLDVGVAIDCPGETPDRAETYRLILGEAGPSPADGSPAVNMPIARVSWSADHPGEVAIVRMPRPLTLVAFEPIDDAYHEWLAPWKRAMERLLAEARAADPARAAVLMGLVTDWPEKTLPELAGMARQIAAMDRYPGDPIAWGLDRIGGASWSHDDLPAEEIPAKLAGLFSTAPKPIGRRRLTEPEDFIRRVAQEFHTLEFPHPLPSGVLELRIPEDAGPPDCLFCQFVGRIGAWPVPRISRGRFATYPLRTMDEGETTSIPLTVSPLATASEPKDGYELWILG